jgi:hypothetical protein
MEYEYEMSNRELELINFGIIGELEGTTGLEDPATTGLSKH